MGFCSSVVPLIVLSTGHIRCLPFLSCCVDVCLVFDVVRHFCVVLCGMVRAGCSDWLAGDSLVVLANRADSSAVFIFSRRGEKDKPKRNPSGGGRGRDG